MLDCGCNVLHRLSQLVGTEQRDTILRRLLLIVISHPHFDHYSYLLDVLCFFKTHRRSFLLPVLLPIPLVQYTMHVLGNDLLSWGIRLVPIQEGLLNSILPLRSFDVISAQHCEEEQISERLKNGIGIRLFRTHHCQHSYAIVIPGYMSEE